MKGHEQFYFFIVYILYFLYLLFFLGLGDIQTQKYISVLNTIVRIYVSGFLIIRFNPLRSLKLFSIFDRNIVFHSGLLLLASFGFENLEKQVNTEIKDVKKDLEEKNNLEKDIE